MNRSLSWIFATVAVISIVGNILLYSKYSSKRVLIRVNNGTIVRKDLDDRLDFLYARPILTQLIWRSLVLQEATARHCLPTHKDVTDALADIERHDPVSLVIARQTDRELDLYKDNLLVNLAVRNLRIADVVLSDAEAREYYAAHAIDFALPKRLLTTTVYARDAIACDAAKSMLTDGVAAANLSRVVGVRLVDLDNGLGEQLPVNLREKMKKLNRGDVAAYPYDGHFIVVRVDSVIPSKIPPYETIQDKVAIAAKLAMAPSTNEVLMGLRRHATITCEAPKYAAAVPEPVVSVGTH